MASRREERYERKRPRDDYDGRDGGIPHYCILFIFFSLGPSRLKRGRFSDQGRGRGQELSTEEKLESFIIRLGEKVGGIDTSVKVIYIVQFKIDADVAREKY